MNRLINHPKYRNWQTFIERSGNVEVIVEYTQKKVHLHFYIYKGDELGEKFDLSVNREDWYDFEDVMISLFEHYKTKDQEED